MAKFFEVDESWDGSLEQDLDEHLHGIREASREGLRFLSSDMRATLRHHIWEDWYKPWHPMVYKRRTDVELQTGSDSAGPPLWDESNMSHTIQDKDENTLSFSFVYWPSGWHENASWSNHREGDELITVIQTNMLWTWQPRDCFPRPFWNNFVEEEKNGAAFDAFEYGFNSSGLGYELKREWVGNITFGASESMLPAGN